MLSRSIPSLRVAAPAIIRSCSTARDKVIEGVEDFAMFKQYMDEINQRIITELEKVLGLRYPKELMMIRTLLGEHRCPLPTLCIASCQAVGVNESRAMPIACILVMMAVATFTRDYAPRMDDLDLQSEKLENYKRFDKEMDPPANDPLICLAYEYLACHAGSMSPEQFVQVFVELSSVCKDLGLVELQYILRHKSGKIFGASAACEVIVGGASEEEVKMLGRFGITTGFLFREVDDIINGTKNREETGDSAGSDPASGKLTFVKRIGTEGAKDYADKLLDETLQLLSGLEPERTARLRDLVMYIHDQQNL
ncbi:hypothetical protein MLD38_013319 [Melastoma candidum]|uniref:Uncharacterized protein n=1 Tax=Melastoma candidum TaxID=119954 RepID=A0ACB9RDC8_9MYRT|nr:hypothetical protein MLD38_013319 [Melastoma candidum]